jgi:hypothetical protein
LAIKSHEINELSTRDLPLKMYMRNRSMQTPFLQSVKAILGINSALTKVSLTLANPLPLSQLRKMNLLHSSLHYGLKKGKHFSRNAHICFQTGTLMLLFAHRGALCTPKSW